MEQRVDGGGPSCFVRLCPLSRTKTYSRPSLDVRPQLPERVVGHRCARTFGNGVASAEYVGDPRVVPFQFCSGGERNQPVHEREPVAHSATAEKTFMDECDCRVGIAALNSGDGVEIQW